VPGQPSAAPASRPGSAADGSGHRRGVPEATVARLPLYLRALHALAEAGHATVSYDVEYLVYQISRELGLTQRWAVVIVGVGNLGHALANYGGFASRGFRIAALLDADGSRVGEVINGVEVRHVDELDGVVRRERVSIGVIATPAAGAQEVCDRLVAAGVTSILNFAPTVLSVPPGVDLRKVDLAIELQILAFHEQRKAGAAPLDRLAAGAGGGR
jgi:redox-sensing transcriptional repressor